MLPSTPACIIKQPKQDNVVSHFLIIQELYNYRQIIEKLDYGPDNHSFIQAFVPSGGESQNIYRIVFYPRD